MADPYYELNIMVMLKFILAQVHTQCCCYEWFKCMFVHVILYVVPHVQN